MKQIFRKLLLLCFFTPIHLYAEDVDHLAKIGLSVFSDKGIPADSVILEEIGSQDGCHVFVNRLSRGGFVVIADTEYNSYLTNPVMAFSTTGRNGWRNYKNNKTLTQLLSYYGRCLKLLKERQTRDVVMEERAMRWPRCKPLLKNNNWGQQKLKFEFGNIALNIVSGCVSTAESQLLRFFQYPAVPKGDIDFCIDTLQNKLLHCNIDTIHINWQELPIRIRKKNKPTPELDKLQSICSMTLFPKYGEESTGASFRQLKRSLVQHFDYSPLMHVLDRDLVAPADMLDAAYAELSQHHPVVVSTHGHCLIMDGYDKGMFHLNFGWHGNCNGYYRLFSVENHFSMLVGIQPNSEINSSSVEKQIELTRAGILAQLLPEAEAMQVSKLIVKGKINADDWQLVRRMAGAVDIENISLPTGRLQYLDLSQARFVDSKKPFMSMTGRQANLRGRITRRKTEKWESMTFKSSSQIEFDTRQITHKKYKELDDVDMLKVCGYTIKEESPDSIYLVQTFLQSDKLALWMFRGCDNLKEIVFGKDIVKTDKCCFLHCSSLENITFYGKDITFSNKTFSSVRRLRTINTYNKSSLKATMFKDCFLPFIGINEL